MVLSLEERVRKWRTVWSYGEGADQRKVDMADPRLFRRRYGSVMEGDKKMEVFYDVRK